MLLLQIDSFFPVNFFRVFGCAGCNAFTSVWISTNIACRPAHILYFWSSSSSSLPEEDSRDGRLQAVDVCARQRVAIKVIDLSAVTEEFRENFLPREIDCWKRIKNLNNCFLYREFVKHDYQFAVMELAEFGDLLSFVQKNGAVQEPLGRNWMIQLVNGLKYLHSRKIAHRDLKMENVLLFRDNIVKICDYGFCKPGIDLSETFCGSKSYSAPEILSGTTYNMYKSDVWSLGVIGFVMVTNTMPYREDVEHNDLIVEAQKSRRYRYPSNLMLSHACKTTLDVMMTFDPIQRPDVKRCCSLPWFQPQPLPDVSHYYPSPQARLYRR
uniref:Protein kinase domain-containing protein n=1 Tax=Ditylenchus dipsaci TaxID=166011 RepID=A0A915D3S1_9BILA